MTPLEAGAYELVNWMPMDGGDVHEAFRAALTAAIEAPPQPLVFPVGCDPVSLDGFTIDRFRLRRAFGLGGTTE